MLTKVFACFSPESSPPQKSSHPSSLTRCSKQEQNILGSCNKQSSTINSSNSTDLLITILPSPIYAAERSVNAAAAAGAAGTEHGTATNAQFAVPLQTPVVPSLQAPVVPSSNPPRPPLHSQRSLPLSINEHFIVLSRLQQVLERRKDALQKLNLLSTTCSLPTADSDAQQKKKKNRAIQRWVEQGTWPDAASPCPPSSAAHQCFENYAKLHKALTAYGSMEQCPAPMLRYTRGS